MPKRELSRSNLEVVWELEDGSHAIEYLDRVRVAPPAEHVVAVPRTSKRALILAGAVGALGAAAAVAGFVAR